MGFATRAYTRGDWVIPRPQIVSSAKIGPPRKKTSSAKFGISDAGGWSTPMRRVSPEEMRKLHEERKRQFMTPEEVFEEKLGQQIRTAEALGAVEAKLGEPKERRIREAIEWERGEKKKAETERKEREGEVERLSRALLEGGLDPAMEAMYKGRLMALGADVPRAEKEPRRPGLAGMSDEEFEVYSERMGKLSAPEREARAAEAERRGKANTEKVQRRAAALKLKYPNLTDEQALAYAEGGVEPVSEKPPEQSPLDVSLQRATARSWDLYRTGALDPSELPKPSDVEMDTMRKMGRPALERRIRFALESGDVQSAILINEFIKKNY